jgi:hypothetical protein
MRTFEMDSATLTALRRSPPHLDRHATHVLSRRAFLGGAVGVTAATVGAGILRPAAAVAAPASNPAPKPTTAVNTLNGVDFHLTFFGPGVDPSSITDFNGFVGVADVQGTGTATNADGSTEPLKFDTDMRFMSGVYVAQDGKVHKGSFGFV